jgi:hypothetical protein
LDPATGYPRIGCPRIGYYDATNVDLKFAAWNGTGWDIEVVDGTAGRGVTSLALDDCGNARISYYGAPSGGLRYDAAADADVAVNVALVGVNKDNRLVNLTTVKAGGQHPFGGDSAAIIGASASYPCAIDD